MTDQTQSDRPKKEMSKKSEKIEIRLSYEEKQELVEAAETEGRSVSDLVRGLIARYMKVTRERLPQKRSWLKWAAIGLAGLLIGHLGTWAYTQSHHHDEPSIYNLGMSIGGGSLQTPILAQDDYKTEITLLNKGEEILVTLTVTEPEIALTILEAKICRKTETNCELISTPILHFNPNQPATIDIQDEDGLTIFMRLSPPRKDAD